MHARTHAGGRYQCPAGRVRDTGLPCVHGCGKLCGSAVPRQPAPWPGVVLGRPSVRFARCRRPSASFALSSHASLMQQVCVSLYPCMLYPSDARRYVHAHVCAMHAATIGATPFFFFRVGLHGSFCFGAAPFGATPFFFFRGYTIRGYTVRWLPTSVHH